MQTVTDYIFEQLEDNSLFFRGTDNELNISISASDYLDLKRLAKEMEKNQIIDAVSYGNSYYKNYEAAEVTGENYYKETYSK